MISVYLPYVLSCITIYTAVLAGDKNRFTWVLGGLNQVLWFVWIYFTESWGFLPMNVVLTAVYLRNHVKWAADIGKT